MKHSFKLRAVCLLLALVMVLGMMPMTAFATETVEDTAASAGTPAVQTTGADYDTGVSGGYYNVISSDTYNLAPGAVEKELVLNNADGTRRQIVHIFEVDTTNENIEVVPGYYQIDKLDPENLADNTYWKAEQLTKTVAYYEDELGYNVVGGMNTALAYDCDAPYDFMVYNGVVLADPANHSGNAQTYLAIYQDGRCELRSRTEPLDGNEWQVIAANFGWLVKDGELVTKTVERTSSAASRSMIGIKADGTLILCQVDGRVSPTSVGLSNYEMGEMMLALGCVNAVNGDGGGSSTFVSKREGTTENVMRSIPSDGSERPTINSAIIVSKAQPTGEFDHATLASEYDYYAPGTSAVVTATGVDAAGGPAEVPADVTWQLADSAMGSVEGGVFTSNGTLGDAIIQMVSGGNVVGELTVHVVHPETFGFDTDSTVIPYGKSAELNVVATYGSDNWPVCVDGAYTLTLSDETAATLEGNVLTAPNDESVTGVDVTATYTHDTAKTDVLSVTYGKGSEILFDFESGDVSDFLGVDEAYQWVQDNGASGPIFSDGNFSDDADSATFLATTENGGQVKHGENALGVTLDYTNAQYASWSYNMFFYVGEPYVLRDVAAGNNATTFGMWVYIPEGAAGMAMQLTAYQGSAEAPSGAQIHFEFTANDGTRKKLNAATEADIPESRWVYASADLTAYDYLALENPTKSVHREPSFIRFYIKPTVAADLTFYFDDFTLDYSSAVEDRVLPTISSVSYAAADTAVTLEEGAVIDGNSMAFSANVSDDAGLNTATGVIEVDGVAVETAVAGSTMSSANVTLLPGTHTVSFEIQDKLGNLARVTRTFTVGGASAVTLAGHNESGAPAEYDSVYYADLNVADIAAIDGLTATLKLQTANTWEPEGITVADGFAASYEYNEISRLLTVTVERVGETALTGAQTLVSIPIRVWSWEAVNHVTGAVITPEAQFATGYCPVVTIDCEVVYGVVDFAEGAYAGYLNTFGGAFSVATNLNDNLNPWHYHTAEAVEDLAADCTHAGYTGRTYCAGCASVVDWGTIVPATGHSYTVTDGCLVCSCGDQITGSGIVSAGGKLYCLIADKVVTGWQAVGTGWCYADPATGEVVTGAYTISGLTYTFGEDGLLTGGVWVTDANGTRYSYGPGFYTRVWRTIDGAEYYFGTDSYMYTGIRRIPVNRNNLNEGYNWYDFGTDGKKAYDFSDYDGIVTSEVDGMHYVKNGMSYYAGLVLVDGYYYYARTSGEIVCGRSYWITKHNDLLPAAMYTFGADGKMIDPPTTEPDPEPEVKNGIVEEDGKKYWYVDGVKTYGGLMLIDGYYYYARTSGEIVCGRSYWITKTNDLLPAAMYTFDADGRMIDPPVA